MPGRTVPGRREGIRGGQVIGDTGADGEQVKGTGGHVSPTWLATVMKGLGIDPMKQKRRRKPVGRSRAGRPEGQPHRGDPRIDAPASAFLALALDRRRRAPGRKTPPAARWRGAARKHGLPSPRERPIFLRLQVTAGGTDHSRRPWPDSVRGLCTPGSTVTADGTLTTKEGRQGRPPPQSCGWRPGGATARTSRRPGRPPAKNGVRLSTDELIEFLQPALGAVPHPGSAGSPTTDAPDALFEPSRPAIRTSQLNPDRAGPPSPDRSRRLDLD